MKYESFANEIIENTKLESLLIKIKKVEIVNDLFSEAEEFIEDNDIRFLAEIANLLASSKSIEHMNKALYISTVLPLINNTKGVCLSSLLTLRKLGNYPAMKLLENKKGVKVYKDLLDGISIFEAHILESLNTENFFGRDFLLTNFQKKIYNYLKCSKAASISAPTSAGKSFVLSKVLLSLVKERQCASALYIVPTKALIRQVMNDFQESITEFGIKNIYVGCSSEIENIIVNKERSNILVLTQERLYQLCTRVEAKKLNVHMIVVDEAHNIQSGGRGVLLESSIKYAKELWSEAKIIFSSPLVHNPQKLLQVFELDSDAFESDTFPLVRQNILKISRKAGNLVIKTELEGKEIDIKSIAFQYKGSSRAQVLANVAMKLWNNNISIIYSNEPMLASDIARQLITSEEFPNLNDERLNEFSDFIEEYISDKYELAQFIRHGIAFHFSALPAILRSGIEDLFKCGALRIICCTSTLLEGLNMPAKNIFMYHPQKGRGNAIDSLSFWNLAGRAGRMNSDFVGNIICIEPDRWENNPLNGEKLQTITPSSEKRLFEESEKIRDYIIDRNKPSGIDDYNEQLTTMIIRERIDGNGVSESKLKNEKNEAILSEIDNIVKIIIEEFNPPLELIKNNPGIIPDRINDLWNFFTVNKDDYEYLIPLYPYDTRGKERFDFIVRAINKYFMFDRDWSEKYIYKVVNVGHKWMTGVPLAQILFYNKDILEKDKRYITKHVKDQIEFLNKNIAYIMVKYTQVYTEVLKVFLKSIGKEETAENLVNISTYLEYGACSFPALEFMALGLPREVSIKLAKKIKLKDPFTSEYCLEWLKKLDVDNLDISNYLKKHISHIQNII